MSAWHREHPELAGTSEDPWMANEGHAAAYGDLVRSGHIVCPECDGTGVFGPDEFGNYDPCETCQRRREDVAS